MGGKFSKRPVTPNKPPVCHKTARLPAVPGALPWTRRGNFFLKWWGDATTGFAYRSWSAELTPVAWPGMQGCEDQTKTIKYEFFITHDKEGKIYDLTLEIWEPARLLFSRWLVKIPKQKEDPWDTGLVKLPVHWATKRCEFRAMA